MNFDYIKCICIKDVEAYSNSFFTIKVGEIVEILSSSFIPVFMNKKSEAVIYNKSLALIDVNDFQKSFIPLADWRNEQIDKILNDD